MSRKAMAAIVPLSLFLVSVSPVAAELEPLEDGCLLQKTKEQQFLVEKQQPVPGYTVLCNGGSRCICREAGDLIENPTPTDAVECAGRCPSSAFPGFAFKAADSKGGPECRCCSGLTENLGIGKSYYLYGFTGAAEGDPHITTLDGRHYTLLSQGTFSFWHFSGLETDFHSAGVVDTKKAPVDWHVYAHYSGQQSFTKGLLLVDKSGGSIRQVLEITSQDCKWKSRKGNEDWKVVDKAEHIFVPDGTDYLTGFDLNSVTGPRGHAGHGFPNRVHFNMNTKNGKVDVAVMSLACKPSHNMNVQILMKRQSDKKFVDGELKVSRKSLSTLQTSTDAEFSVDTKWKELGGSAQAASYFQLVDTNQTSVASLQSQGCSEAAKALAKETCLKHLGDAHGTYFFEDCVFDVCHGAGEMQAELTAELLAVTKAD